MAPSVTSYVINYVISLIPMLAFPGASACSQILDGYIPITEILAGQFLFQALGGLPSVLVSLRQTPPEPERRHVIGVVLVSFTKFVTHLLLFISPILAPAGVVQGIYNIFGTSTSIVYLLMKTRACSVRLSLPLCIAVVGIVLTSQPEFLGFPSLIYADNYVSVCIQQTKTSLTNMTSHMKNESLCRLDNSTLGTFNHSRCITGSTDTWEAWTTTGGYILASIAGICQGCSFLIYTEYIPDVSPMLLSVGVGGICAALGTLGLLFFQSPTLPTGALCWTVTFGLIVPEGLGTTVLNICVLRIGAAAMSMILTLTPVLVMIFQYTFLSHIRPGHRNWEEILGIILLTIANILYPALTLLEERKRSDYERFNDEEIIYAREETGKQQETSIN